MLFFFSSVVNEVRGNLYFSLYNLDVLREHFQSMHIWKLILPLFLGFRFLLIRLKEFCGEFLKKKLHLSNCVAIHSLAHMYTLSQLALKAADMIRRNFHKVIQDEEFYTLPFHLIRDWLSDLEITVDSEEVLFETVLKWVQRNAEERERYFNWGTKEVVQKAAGDILLDFRR